MMEVSDENDPSADASAASSGTASGLGRFAGPTGPGVSTLESVSIAVATTARTTSHRQRREIRRPSGNTSGMPTRAMMIGQTKIGSLSTATSAAPGHGGSAAAAALAYAVSPNAMANSA